MGELCKITNAAPGSAVAAPAQDVLTPDVLQNIDICLESGGGERDVLNTTIVWFNEAHRACSAEPAACEAARAAALTARADAQRRQMRERPSDVDEADDGWMPAVAGDRYREVLGAVEQAAAMLCSDLTETEGASCASRAQAVRLARLRSPGSQIDPRVLLS